MIGQKMIMEPELEAYDPTLIVNTIVHDRGNILEITRLFLSNDLFEQQKQVDIALRF